MLALISTSVRAFYVPFALIKNSEVIAYITTNTNNVNISSLFSSTDWADTNKQKRLIINSGVTVGSTDAAMAALRTGTGRSGNLVIVNQGTVAGAGGTANGGAGGNALLVEQVGVAVLNSGTLAGGGGGGGKGGNGGDGSYTTTTRQPTSGEYYSVSGTTYYWTVGTGSASITWAGALAGNPGTSATSYKVGSWTYYRGVSHGGSPSTRYGVYRVATNTVSTNGGIGGNGGRGQGSDGAATAGLTGAAGGTNAGTGGTGGAGGAYGTAGASGGTGTAGNVSAGLAGTAGGAAGAAVTGTGYTVTNTGSILGSY